MSRAILYAAAITAATAVAAIAALCTYAAWRVTQPPARIPYGSQA